jgi:ketosteroid isomerase-like protein
MATVKEAADHHIDAFNLHDVEAFVANEDPDIEFVVPGGVTLRGRDQVRQFMPLLWEAFPDINLTVTSQVVAGETAVTESTYEGTHTGTWRTPNGDILPTGRRIRGRQVAVQRVKAGLIASEHLYFDQLEMLIALGLLPEPSHTK